MAYGELELSPLRQDEELSPYEDEDAAPLLPTGSRPARPPLRRTRTGTTSAVTRALPLALWCSYNLFYKLSLVPATTPKQMNGWLPYIGTVMVLSVLSLSALLWLAFWQQPVLRRVILITIPVNLGAWMLIDSGNRLEEHGAFNMLVFAIMFTPLNMIALIGYNWWRFAAGGKNGTNKRFIVQLVAFIIFSIVALAWLTTRDRAWAKHGFFDETIQGSHDEGFCEWKPTTAWLQLLPFRQNFFVGPLTCSRDTSFSARFVNDMLVIDDCYAAETPVRSYIDQSLLQTISGPAFSLLPVTREWSLTQKTDSLSDPINHFQINVLEYIHNHTYPYSQPVSLDPSIDTVIARCGTAEPKLVYRIATPPVTTSKPVPPPGLNIVTLFIDSVSRPMLHRKLPLTIAALELAAHAPSDATNSSAATLYEFFRFHTVGINTGPNTRALWAGLETPLLDDFASPEIPTGPAVWEQFHNAGYVAGRADSMCQDWDSYYNTKNAANTTAEVRASLDHEFIAYSCLPPYLPPSKRLAGNFKGPQSIVPRCLSGQHESWHTLDWSEEFIRAQRAAERPFYLNAGFMDSHEGSGEMIRAMDERLAKFIHPHTTPIDYSDTVLLVLSDHGALMGLNYVFFANGKVERAMPFAAALVPDEWAKEEGRADMLDRNRMELITAFDFYETVRGWGGIEPEVRERRGKDLSVEDLAERGCEEAGIPKEDCMCI